MRLFKIVVVMVMLCLLGISAMADETAAQTAKLKLNLTPGQVLRYEVKVQAVGTNRIVGNAQPNPLDTTMDITMSYSVGEPDKDGALQVTIAPESVSATVNGQKMELPNNYISKTIALINPKGEVINLLTSDPLTIKLPGINSNNLILLFLPNAPSGDLKPGTTWKKTMSLPSDPEVYKLSYMLEALEDAFGIETARVKTELVVKPRDGDKYSARGFAVTNYALDDVRLIKSHAEMTVKVEDKADAEIPGQIEAVVKVDVRLISGIELIK